MKLASVNGLEDEDWANTLGDLACARRGRFVHCAVCPSRSWRTGGDTGGGDSAVRMVDSDAVRLRGLRLPARAELRVVPVRRALRRGRQQRRRGDLHGSHRRDAYMEYQPRL